ncbi:MAG TPA: MotA/TolQ/ExbB proton channel family protein [Solimonas sp.]|nr:MotA/TolQ/ExbB proton channel family protein [Solimonas sp.]
MKTSFARALCALLLGATLPAVAQTAGLDKLLKEIRESGAASSKLNQEREARFLRNKAEQAAELAKAEAAFAAAKARADAVKARFDGNQKGIADLKVQLQTRAGDYTQVVAAVRQVAGDFRTGAAESLVTAQFPERLEFLGKIAQGTELPSVADLENLWFTLSQEMTENGKVARFDASIVNDAGVPAQGEVIRVGAFSAFAGDQYLVMTAGNPVLTALPHQPESKYRRMAEDFAGAQGLAPVLVDPSRGNLLVLSGERPGPMERVEQGGIASYAILVIGLLGAVVAVYQLVYLLVVGMRVRRQLRSIGAPSTDNPLGRVLSVLRDERSNDPELLELHLSEAVLRETPKLERFQSMLRMIVAAGPLLGLLGTVGGMIVTFQVITEVGAGDPKLMAGGISQAMISTLLGLGIAIPLLFVNSVLSSRSRVLVQILDEQSAGLLAQRLEASRNA